MPVNNHASPYTLPAGFLGELANFIYEAAPRPVPEIALAGAIGLMAGIVGRAYNVSGTGLNQYILLLAPTGTGKEGAASGVRKLMKAVRKSVVGASDFIGPGEIASAQALIKYLAKFPSFLSMVGEFGIYLQQMAKPNAAPHLVGIRRILLVLFNVSGADDELQQMIYSEKEKNTPVIKSPAFSLLGESTPEKFYEGLHDGLISEGLLPRFTTIEYNGERPALNESRLNEASPELIQRLATLCAYSLSRNQLGQPVEVQLTEEAKTLFDKFNRECDAYINDSKKEITKQLWNRAHIKALKMAALVAVGVYPYAPEITLEFALWAIRIEKTNVNNLLARFDAGEVGEQAQSETAQQNRVRAVITDWFVKPWAELQRYKIGTEAMRDNAIVPYSYISKRLTNDVAFKNAKNGASSTIKRTIDELFKCGEVSRVSAAQLQKIHGTTMECYALTKPEQFLAAFKHEVKLAPKFF